jgi:transcription elongation factor GreA
MILTGFNTNKSDKYTKNREQEYNNIMDLITEKGRKDVHEKISELQKRKPFVSEQIAAARENGGIDENEELYMALEDLQRLDVEISRLQSIVDKSQELKIPPPNDYPTIRPGMTVQLENFNIDKIVTYTILGEYESDPNSGSISFKSPLGKELLGLHVGSVVELIRGDNVIEYEVLRIFVE